MRLAGFYIAMKEFLKWLKSVFAECDGCASFSRLSTAFITLCVMTFMGFYLYWKHEFPSYDVNLSLSILMTAHYGTNKLPDMIASFRGKKADPTVTNTATPPVGS